MANSARNNPGTQQTVNNDESKALDRLLEMYEKNKKRVNTIVTVVLVAVLGYFTYTQWYLKPREEKAATAISFAQRYFEMDSLNLALNGDGQHSGFLKAMKKFSGTKTANLCNYYAGVCYLQMGDFKNAVKYLEDFDGHGSLLTYAASGALGDAYMETNNQKKAMEAYEKAIGNKNDNQLTPMYLQRLALLCELNNKNEDAKKYYERIRDEYPQSQEARDVEKYLGHLGDHD
ncbi:MAG: tetratricopeptide repeat protein [Bacteroidetes bacterium]|nr:tetratricopeptide repeat protein [Bacteroidota bacterium]